MTYAGTCDLFEVRTKERCVAVVRRAFCVPFACPRDPLGPARGLGSEFDAVTMRYAHLSPDVKRDAVRLLDRPPSRAPVSEPAAITAEPAP